MKKTCLALLLFLLTIQGWTQPPNAKFVWKDAKGEGRQQTVLFRRNFDLDNLPDKAFFHLFADSRYHLYVNGVFVNFGPSRFYPAHPDYDTHDLARYLIKGENVVAVAVLTNGTETYQVPLSNGGFIAWGDIESSSGKISFETPGDWRMFVSGAYDHDALRFSFACGPMEVFDGRRQPADWNRAGFDDRDWERPVVHQNQDHWGTLSPRTIPFMTRDEREPEQLLGIYRERQEEDLYKFFIKTPDRVNAEYNAGKQMYGCTYIWSPVKQDVELGLWWGTYYLNGEGPIEASGNDPRNPVRQRSVFSLEEGWNYLFISYVAIWGGWDYYMAVPKKSGLIFSTRREKQGGPMMLTAGPFPKGIGLFNSGRDDPGDDQNILHNSAYGWTPRENLQMGPNPARDLVWRTPDLDHNLKKNDFQVSSFEIEAPVMMVFDMGGKKLGRVFCELDAHPGAVVDMAWSEDLNADGFPFLYKRLQVNAAARFIATEGKRRYETFKPYGVRYLLVRVDPGKAPCKLERVGLVEQVYPHKKQGSFSCSNPMLDRIWELGWRTLRVCSEDSYTDTPFRERGLYAGDALPEYGITLATSGDSRLLKRSLILFQDMYEKNLLEGKEEGLNDFVLKTLLLLEWYYQVSGDTAFLKAVYPNYQTLMQSVMKREKRDGYYPTNRVFIEWTQIDKTADLAAYQALLARSFRVLSGLAGELGLADDALLYSLEADRLASVVTSIFWDSDKQCYHDGFKDGKAIDHHYPISNIYPLLFDLCPEEQKPAILSYLEHEILDIGEEVRNRRISPYGAFYLLSALYKEGRVAAAERFMIQYWSRMIHQGDDTSWENFDIGGEQQGGQGTASHAWSGHPTFFLSTEVLGVKLGFVSPIDRGVIEISPQSENLTWARGTVPHPAGLVHVDWRIEGDNLVMNVGIPEGVAYEVHPQGKLGELTLNLNVITENTRVKSIQAETRTWQSGR